MPVLQPPVSVVSPAHHYRGSTPTAALPGISKRMAFTCLYLFVLPGPFQFFLPTKCSEQLTLLHDCPLVLFPCRIICLSSRSSKHQGIQQTFYFALFLPSLVMRETCVLFRFRRLDRQEGGGRGSSPSPASFHPFSHQTLHG